MKLLRLLGSSVLVTSLGAIALACSSTDAGSTAEGACAQYASAYRSYAQKCGGATATSEARWQTLVSRMQLACGSALGLPGTGITPANITVCANALKSASCLSDLDDLPECDFPNGSLADGAPCSQSQQCASGACRKTATGTGSAACGTCLARIPVGGDCGTEMSSCVEDARCDATTRKCVAVIRNGVGGSCDSAKNESCQTNLYCDFSTKTCKERVPEGGACPSGTLCQSGLTCNATSRTCVKPVRATEGQACGGTTGISCDTGLRCDTATMKCIKVVYVAPGGDCGAPGTQCEIGSCNSTTRKCPAVIADGQPCTSDRSTGVCQDFASCIEGKCLLPGQVVCK